jgi:hypothetical protein
VLGPNAASGVVFVTRNLDLALPVFVGSDSSSASVIPTPIAALSVWLYQDRGHASEQTSTTAFALMAAASPTAPGSASSSSLLIRASSGVSTSSSSRSTESVQAVPFTTRSPAVRTPARSRDSSFIAAKDQHRPLLPDQPGHRSAGCSITDHLPQAMQSQPRLLSSSFRSSSATPPTPPGLKTPDIPRPVSSASGGVIVVRKTVQDFEMGELLGEGSYSTVRLAVLFLARPLLSKDRA